MYSDYEYVGQKVSSVFQNKGSQNHLTLLSEHFIKIFELQLKK
jgi:hypothetical protein